MRLPTSLPGAANPALSTLTDSASIVRRTLDPDWVPSDGPQSTVDTPVWTGCASLGAGSVRLSTTAVPDREVGTDRLRVPQPCDGGPDDVQVGDIVTLASLPGQEWVIARPRDRTTSVLQRLTVVDARYAEGIPR